MSKRALTIFSLTFAAVLVAGVAFAQVGAWAPADDEPTVVEAASGSEAEPKAEEPAEEPKHEAEPKDEPTDEGKPPSEEPIDKEGIDTESEESTGPKEEPKEEPAAEEEHEGGLFIEVLYPSPESETDDKIQVFEGIATPGAEVFRGKFQAEMNEEGGWRIALVLSPGKNKVTFEARDIEGNIATDYVVVFLVGHDEEKEEPKDEKGDHDWSAYQKYGSCEESPPYDVFYGTGVPGATVWVESKYGGGTTTIGPEGNWDIKVKFYEAPYGEELKVVVESEGGRSVFHFTSYAGGEGKEG